MTNPEIKLARRYPICEALLQLMVLEAQMESCLAVGSTRKAILSTDFGPFDLDIHYNLYKESVERHEEQRRNLTNLMACYGVRDFVSTALFYGTTDVAYASKNGIRILGAGRGKTAYLKPNYDRFLRSGQLHADGIICEPGSGIVPVTYSADCVTGVFSAPNGAYGVFHSMAKMLAHRDDNIILSMVRAFERLWRINPEELELAIFPSVSPAVYEVDKEFAELFSELYITHEQGKKPRLHLEQMAVDLASFYGVGRIAVSGYTTAWTGLESLRGAEHSIMANGEVGNANGQNIVFAVPSFARKK